MSRPTQRAQKRAHRKKMRRKKRDWKKADRKRRNPSLRARVYEAAKNGVAFKGVPANIPRKSQLASDMEQAKWVKNLMNERDIDYFTIAEAHDGLVKALWEVGLFVVKGGYNPGKAMNIIVLKDKPRSHKTFDISYRTVHNTRETLWTAEAKVRKGPAWTTIQAVHVPARGSFSTSATDDVRGEFVRDIARHKVSTKSRQASGDWNGTREWVLGHLRAIDSRWVYLGGQGVDMTFGIRANSFGDVTIGYGNKSDHEHTSIVSYGVPIL